MPTVHTDVRRNFASLVLAAVRVNKCAWWRLAPALGAAAWLALGAGLVGGCTWFGLSHGGADAGRVEPKAAPALDALAEARVQTAAAPREPYWPYHLAELEVAADSSAAAMDHLNATLALDPDYAPAVSLLSKIYYDAKMYPQAVTLLEGYLARHSDAPDALRASLALHYDALGQADQADAALARCAPGARDAQGARVLASLRNSDSTAMLDAAQRALADDPKSAVNHNNYGVALLIAGRPTEAKNEFNAALDIDGALPGALYNMAILESFYLFDDSAGREWYTRYLRVASDDPDHLKAHFESDVSTTEPSRP